MLNQLQDAAAKEAEQRLRDFQKHTGLQTADDFKMWLQSAGPDAGRRPPQLRAQLHDDHLLERTDQAEEKRISLIDVKDYYTAHAEEFVTADRVKWQDIFIRMDRFKIE